MNTAYKIGVSEFNALPSPHRAGRMPADKSDAMTTNVGCVSMQAI